MGSLNNPEEESLWAELVKGDGEADLGESVQNEKRIERKTIYDKK